MVFDWGSTKPHLFLNPGIARLVAIERDLKPLNLNFAKVEKREGGLLIGINTDKYGNLCSFNYLKNSTGYLECNFDIRIVPEERSFYKKSLYN